jgi:hypothetical protein
LFWRTQACRAMSGPPFFNVGRPEPLDVSWGDGIVWKSNGDVFCEQARSWRWWVAQGLNLPYTASLLFIQSCDRGLPNVKCECPSLTLPSRRVAPIEILISTGVVKPERVFGSAATPSESPLGS